jgi:hypothetical protein
MSKISKRDVHGASRDGMRKQVFPKNSKNSFFDEVHGARKAQVEPAFPQSKIPDLAMHPETQAIYQEMQNSDRAYFAENPDVESFLRPPTEWDIAENRITVPGSPCPVAVEVFRPAPGLRVGLILY